MPEIVFHDVAKSFGSSTVIERFNATIRDGEFMVLLGPSGCGKSTLLRMIAGLTPISAGEVRFDGSVVNEWAPRRRGIAFVFQTYALYPHMTVRGNISFPLVMDAFRKWHHLPIVNAVMRRHLMKSKEISERTERIARQLELEAYLDRRPASLSGGQRQRVALGRALIRNPSLYLLDEPLSNLDAKLRTQMRSEISALHHRVRKTFVYVTHDQVEAMTMATRIIVMDKGRIQQIGTPDEIYHAPVNTFVARFVGSPPMNLLRVLSDGKGLRAQDGLSWAHDGPVPQIERLLLGIRPEKLILGSPGAGRIPARVALVERLGSESMVGCRLGSLSVDEGRLVGEELVFAKLPGSAHIAIDEPCSLDYRSSDIVWFDETTGRRA
jgi:multiple sugar transport system ATP-binding protein